MSKKFSKSYEKAIVFDLDDTLYQEIDFVRSAYNYIQNFILLKYKIDISPITNKAIKDLKIRLYDEIIKQTYLTESTFPLNQYLILYRYHYPNLSINQDLISFLDTLKNQYLLGLITNGRSVTQRNKLRALQLINFFDTIIISEESGYSKPQPENYKSFEILYPECKQFIYIGDNSNIDFKYPSISEKWTPICLLNKGENIHKQDSSCLNLNKVQSINELYDLKHYL